jgi:hypothetical protein
MEVAGGGKRIGGRCGAQRVWRWLAWCFGTRGKLREKPKGGSRARGRPSINRGPENGGLRRGVKRWWCWRGQLCSHS